MKPDTRELRWALIAIVGITAVYALVVRRLQAAPAASSLFGHSIGVLGFVLMLSTETLYSLRKRSRRARWGRMASWLRFHIFTGLVGPYMVLLHTSWKFQGLAGLVTLMTGVVVASGFVGRYIYTAAPRNADGLLLEAGEVQAQIDAAEAELRQALAGQPAARAALSHHLNTASTAHDNPALAILGRVWFGWRSRRQWRHELAGLDPAARGQAGDLLRLLERRQSLQRQASTLAAARRLLGIWHTVHIPLGMALFAAASVHIAAALYFATLLQ